MIKRLMCLVIPVLAMTNWASTAHAADLPQGVTVYWGASSAGEAVTELEDGCKYLIYDAYDGSNGQGQYFRYANPEASSATKVLGTKNTDITASFDYGPEYVWIAEYDATNDAWQFKSEKYKLYMAWASVSSGNVNHPFLLQEEASAYPYTVTFSGSEARVNNGAAYWDGNSDGNMVGWGSGTGHPYQFFKVTDENCVEYCNYKTQTYLGTDSEPIHSSETANMSKVSSIPTAAAGVTITQTAEADGSLMLSGRLTYTSTCDVTLKNQQMSTYAYYTGSAVQFTESSTDAAAQWTLYFPTDNKLQFYMYNQSAKRFMSGLGDDSGSSVTLVDIPAATLLQMVINDDRTEAIYDASQASSGSYYLNWRSGTLGTWRNDTQAGQATGSHWYTVVSEDILTANTATGVLDALTTAIGTAQTVVDNLKTSDENAATDTDVTALEALISEAQAAFIGRQSFSDLTTQLTTSTEALTAKYAKVKLYMAIKDAEGVYIAHDVPGYLSTSTEKNVALKTAIDAAQQVYDNETSTEYDAQVTALTDAVSALTAVIASATSQTAIYTTGFYKISNKNGRGSLYYNSANPDFIWSTGKNSTDDETVQIWGFVEKNGKYYLFNTAAKKFAGLGTGSFSAQTPNLTWSLTETEPEAIELAAADSSFGYPYVEISCPSSDKDTRTDKSTVHMSVSNDYNGPIICYYAATDGGVPFIFEWVSEADANLQAEMLAKIDVSAVADTYIEKIEAFESGNEIGKFSADTKTAAINALKALKDDDTATLTTVANVYSDFLTKFNLPVNNDVYTIESYHTSDGSYRMLYNNWGTVQASATEAAYGRLNYRYWLCTLTDGVYKFTNSIDWEETGSPTVTTLTAKSATGQITIKRDPNIYGCVNLWDSSTYVMVMNEATTPTVAAAAAADDEVTAGADSTSPYYAIDRSTSPTVSNASGQFRITLVDGGSSVTTRLVETLAEGHASEVIYDLQGRRVAQPGRSGLYIVNGVKRLIRK